MIEVKYKCLCTADEVTLQVPQRFEEENVIEWMERVVQQAIYLDHRTRSPKCRATAMEYAKLHMPNEKGIGYDSTVQ